MLSQMVWLPQPQHYFNIATNHYSNDAYVYLFIVVYLVSVPQIMLRALFSYFKYHFYTFYEIQVFNSMSCFNQATTKLATESIAFPWGWQLYPFVPHQFKLCTVNVTYITIHIFRDTFRNLKHLHLSYSVRILSELLHIAHF